MPPTPFYVNTALICYNCPKTAVLRLDESWREVTRLGKDTDVLDVIFTVCVTCLRYPHVHDPGTAVIPRYLDHRIYLHGSVQPLVELFNCQPSIYSQRKFSVTALRCKVLTRIRDPDDLFDTRAIPDANIMILYDGYEITRNCQFFRHETSSVTRKPKHSLFPLLVGPNEDTFPSKVHELLPPDLIEDAPPRYSQDTGWLEMVQQQL
ncbi:hypothetical protein BKA65DRAFT_591149 [Rhexocercosporidium sp. MPI-PUGE-AT-0058]|nr:hypothetical protein BKA65DRAFT_591149 [Rhexocercosporidium sp. MPI-PUGE-AT-0058]